MTIVTRVHKAGAAGFNDARFIFAGETVHDGDAFTELGIDLGLGVDIELGDTMLMQDILKRGSEFAKLRGNIPAIVSEVAHSEGVNQIDAFDQVIGKHDDRGLMRGKSAAHDFVLLFQFNELAAKTCINLLPVTQLCFSLGKLGPAVLQAGQLGLHLLSLGGLLAQVTLHLGNALLLLGFRRLEARGLLLHFFNE